MPSKDKDTKKKTSQKKTGQKRPNYSNYLKKTAQAEASARRDTPVSVDLKKESQMYKEGKMPKTAGMGAGDVAQVPNFWYSPELTMESWLLPKSRQEILKWARLFYNLEPYIQCLPGDTEIPLLTGEVKPIKELYDEEAKDIPIYGVSLDGQVQAGKAQEVKLTRENAKLVKVGLSTHKSFKCTPDHKILLREGTYKEAQNLLKGDKVMPFYRNSLKRHYDPKTQSWGSLGFEAEDMPSKYLDNVIIEGVEKVEKREDTYDLVSAEPYNNFALNCGVFVHNSIITMHAYYPFSKFDITTDHPRVTEFYRDQASNSRFELFEFMLQASLSYWKFGEALPFGTLGTDAQGRTVWDKYILLEPELVEIRQGVFDEEPQYELIPTNELKGIVSEKQKGKLEKEVPEVVVDAIEQGKNIPLDPRFINPIQRITDPSASRGTSPIQCLAGDTKIALLDGTTPTIGDLYKKDKKDFWVHSFDEEGNFKAGKATRVIKTGEKKTLELTFDNEESFRCTEDHLILTRAGLWKRADELEINDSIMPLYRKTSEKGVEGRTITDYELVYIPSEDRYEYTHKLVTDQVHGLKKGETCHHKNFDKKDNSPSNLLPTPRNAHIKFHRELVARLNEDPEYLKNSSIGAQRYWDSSKSNEHRKLNSKLRKLDWQDPNYRKRMLKAVNSKKHHEACKEALNKPEVRNKISKGVKESLIDGSFEHHLNTYPMLRKVRKVIKKALTLNEDEFVEVKGKDKLRRTFYRYIKRRDYNLRVTKLREKDTIRIYKEISKCKQPTNHKITGIKECGIESVYDIESVSPTHSFCVAFDDNSGVVVHNCCFKVLIYQDFIRLAQMAIATRYHFPVELWTVGDPANDIWPTEEELEEFRNMINQAIQNPPASIVYPPIVNYEALSVLGRLLPVSDDYAYIHDQLLVGLGVNKALIKGEGASFTNTRTIALEKLIMIYQTIRDKFENWMINSFFAPLAEENDFYEYKHGQKKLILPNIHWYKDLDAAKKDARRDQYISMHEKGYVSTQTLFTAFPDLDLDKERKLLEEEKGSVFDKKDDRIPEEFIPGAPLEERDIKDQLEFPLKPVTPAKPEKPEATTPKEEEPTEEEPTEEE